MIFIILLQTRDVVMKRQQLCIRFIQ